MSTRDEILAALTEYPGGLTSKELAPHCPAAECDEMIVGRNIATLRQEGVIHAATESRDGAAVWLLGKPEEETPIERVTVPNTQARDAGRLSRAASRGISTSSRPASDAPTPIRAQPSAPIREGTKPEEHMQGTVIERALAALKRHGPLSLEDLAKYSGSTKGSMSTYTGTLVKKHGVTRVKGQRGVYQLGESKPPKAPAAAPSRSAALKTGDALYAAALLDLREKRDELLNEVQKLDRAIEAVGALAA